MARDAAVLEAVCLQLRYQVFGWSVIGSRMVSEAYLGGGEAGLLITAALPFKIAWFLCQSQPPLEYLQLYEGLS